MKVKILQTIIALFILASIMACPAPNLNTESGKELSSNFGKVYAALSVSQDFYEQSKSAIKEGAQEGLIAEKHKDRITTAAKHYKETHNAAVKAVNNWYDAVENDEEYDVRFVVELLYDVSDKGRLLSQVVTSVSDGKVQLPSELIPTVTEIALAIYEVKE